MSERNYKEETSQLVRSLQIASASQSEKAYRGNSRDKKAAAKISGKHELIELHLDHEAFGITEEQAREVEEATTEAVNRALANSQSAARRAIEEGLKAE